MVRIGNFFFRYRNGLFPVVMVLMFVPSPKLFSQDLVAAGLGLAVALVGQLIRAITIGLAYIIRGGKNRQVYAETLVQEGIFAHCRNPLYVGNILVILGLGLVSNSLLFALIGVPFFLFVYWTIVAAEENFLRQKFGADFDAYCQRVSRFKNSASRTPLRAWNPMLHSRNPRGSAPKSQRSSAPNSTGSGR